MWASVPGTVRAMRKSLRFQDFNEKPGGVPRACFMGLSIPKTVILGIDMDYENIMMVDIQAEQWNAPHLKNFKGS